MAGGLITTRAASESNLGEEVADLELDVVKTGWSAFEALAVNFETTPAASFVREQEWEDSNSYRLGYNHGANEEWDIRLGALYAVGEGVKKDPLEYWRRLKLHRTIETAGEYGLRQPA